MIKAIFVATTILFLAVAQVQQPSLRKDSLRPTADVKDPCFQTVLAKVYSLYPQVQGWIPESITLQIQKSYIFGFDLFPPKRKNVSTKASVIGLK